MKNKKAFTLIELLAVIVILAIIALIAVPVIMNIINKANKSAFKDTAYGVISAGELYFAEQQLDLNGMSGEEEFTFENGKSDKDGKIEVKGNVPNGTILKINEYGEIALAMSNGRYCITKGYKDKDITITENYTECNIPEEEKTEKTLKEIVEEKDNACLAQGTICDVGTAFNVWVNANDKYKFYVLKDEDNKVTLIMNQNLYEKGNNNEPDVAWINASDYAIENNKDENPNICSYNSCNDEGPVTAINTLNERTSDWDYITAKPYTYKGMAEDGTTRIYANITITMKARMLTYEEATSDIIGCEVNSGAGTAGNGSCPSWLYENLMGNGDQNSLGYWLSTASLLRSDYAYYVHNLGAVVENWGEVHDNQTLGIRPVIELSK